MGRLRTPLAGALLGTLALMGAARASSEPASIVVETGDAGTPGPPPPEAFDPRFHMSPRAHEWWVEVYADADTVELEIDSGGRAPLSRTSCGSFAATAHIPHGTPVRLLARRGNSFAVSRYFAFLEEAPRLATDADAWRPELRLGAQGEWFVEVYAEGAQRVTLSVDNAPAMDLPRTTWGSFARSTYVPRGAHVEIEATRADGATALATYIWLE